MRRLVVFLIVVVLLLLAADRIGHWAAERAMADEIQRSENLSRTPSVSIAGFPFLTQAVAGTYRQVNIGVQDLPAAQGVTVSKLDVTFHGVHVPLRQAVSGQVNEVDVDRAEAAGTIGFASINAAAASRIPSEQLRVTFGPAGSSDKVTVTGTYTGPVGLTGEQGQIKISGQAKMLVEGNKLFVSVVPDSLTGVPLIVRRQVADLLGVSYALPTLPFGFKATSLSVGPGGVTARATSNHLSFVP